MDLEPVVEDYLTAQVKTEDLMEADLNLVELKMLEALWRKLLQVCN